MGPQETALVQSRSLANGQNSSLLLTYSCRVKKLLPALLLPLPDVQQCHCKDIPHAFTPRRSARLASRSRIPLELRVQLSLAAKLGIKPSCDMSISSAIDKFRHLFDNHMLHHLVALAELFKLSIPDDFPPVKDALVSGPDGFIALFYQKSWDIIKGEILTAFFYLGRSMGNDFYRLNQVLTTLLPKKLAAQELKDFQPISLLHSFVELFSKVLPGGSHLSLPRWWLPISLPSLSDGPSWITSTWLGFSHDRFIRKRYRAYCSSWT